MDRQLTTRVWVIPSNVTLNQHWQSTSLLDSDQIYITWSLETIITTTAMILYSSDADSR
jgi:hypothetical protein